MLIKPVPLCLDLILFILGIGLHPVSLPLRLPGFLTGRITAILLLLLTGISDVRIFAGQTDGLIHDNTSFAATFGLMKQIKTRSNERKMQFTLQEGGGPKLLSVG